VLPSRNTWCCCAAAARAGDPYVSTTMSQHTITICLWSRLALHYVWLLTCVKWPQRVARGPLLFRPCVVCLNTIKQCNAHCPQWGPCTMLGGTGHPCPPVQPSVDRFID
jgi:hypothetical protein